jgi:hypothetical protein
MNNIKIVYFNTETINKVALETILYSHANCISHYEIKQGLFLINFNGTARALYEIIENVVNENSILIHDLDCDESAYWGFMNKNVWEWLKNNRH